MTTVDTHAHFWDVETFRYSWIETGSPFDRNFMLADYQQASSGVPIERMVFVECDADATYSIAEAEWVANLAAAEPRIQGIVARAALLEPDATERLARVAAVPLVCGIRDNIQGHHPGFAIQDAFVRGVHEVFRKGLHFELCLKHDQLCETIELVRRCPEGQFVLDHCGKPDIASGLREPWLTNVRELASLKNVVCKISGLVTEADWDRWQPDQVLWYAREAADAFGPDRIMFGSDWPVNEVAGGYVRWFRLAEELASEWSHADRERFFRSNAERIYRLA